MTEFQPWQAKEPTTGATDEDWQCEDKRDDDWIG